MTNEEKLISNIKNIPVEQLMTLPYFENRGAFFLERALIQDAQGQRELTFSNEIKRYHEDSHSGGLNGLVNGETDPLTIAFSVFQWLTTNVGGDVLRGALLETGRRIVDIEK